MILTTKFIYFLFVTTLLMCLLTPSCAPCPI
nr:hypothetical protein KDAJHZZV_KDAJHZZV_CDS_0008 [Microvirus sp.]